MKNNRRKQSAGERFESLTDAEKKREVAAFDQEFAADRFTALPPKARAAWNRAKKRMGRPKIGKGAKIVPVSIEGGLLQKADMFCKRAKMSRSAMVAKGLELVMAGDGAD